MTISVSEGISLSLAPHLRLLKGFVSHGVITQLHYLLVLFIRACDSTTLEVERWMRIYKMSLLGLVQPGRTKTTTYCSWLQPKPLDQCRNV